MRENHIPVVNVEELMERIKTGIRQQDKPEAEMSQPFSEPPYTLDAVLSTEEASDHYDHYLTPESSVPEFKQGNYHINDFLKYHDRDFVINAFRGILRRNPDTDGFEYFLHNLRSGLMTKAEIMGRLRYSPEGRAKNVRIRILRKKLKI